MVLMAALWLAASAGAAKLTPVGTYERPTFVTSDPGDPDRLFVVEKNGKIQLTANGETGVFVDLDQVVNSVGGEQGLLSMAFAPDFATSGLLYVYYTGNDDGAIHVAELTASGNTADPRTLRNVITVPHPEFPNHNGGQLQFGPDGFLYIGTGDGGGSGDPFDAGQNLADRRGKLLRIDPRRSGTQPYSVPADNPFVGVAGAAREVWSYGLRNPYRFSFDRETGALTIGDVGQAEWEEVNFAPQPAAGRGVNYGWDCREGAHSFEPAGCEGVVTTDPVLEYSRDDRPGSCSVTGGYVVRDPGLPELEGRYLYADYCEGLVRSAVLAPGASTGDRSERLEVAGPATFGEDSCGRVYVASLFEGDVFRLEDSTPTDCTGVGGDPPVDPPAERCSDVLRGTNRADVLKGGPGSQRIKGRSGPDRVGGGRGNDCLSGGRGGDRLAGGFGRDVLRGGRGRDFLNARDGTRDKVLCGKGRDRARVDRFDKVRGCERVRRAP